MSNGVDVYSAMLALGLDAEIVGCLQDAHDVLAFDLPESDRRSFLLFHDYITNPQPRFITEWRGDPSKEKWYRALVDGLNFNTHNGYACVV